MPVLSRFRGISIYIYAREHGTPHLHAKYQNEEVVLNLEGDILDGKLPKKQLRLVQAWAVMRSDEILKKWKMLQQGLVIDQIEPLN